MPENRIPTIDGPWVRGVDSLSDPLYTPQGCVQWSINTLNRGGIYQTRPGYSILYDSTTADNLLFPRGFTVFTPKDGDPVLVKAVGTKIKYSSYPYVSWAEIDGITMDDSETPVHMETCIKGLETLSDETVTVLDPYPVLMISNGATRAAIWDGVNGRHLDPNDSETPIGTWMKWMGNRLWLAQGSKLLASNLLEPDKFTEINDVAGGGPLYMPGAITGIGGTANQQSLLVFTDSTTSAVQAQILDRLAWGATQDFQKVILPEIGCIAGRSIVNQYGMTWWYSQGGLISLDEALLAYRSSKLHFKDELMARSKMNIASDASGIASGAFGNFLLVSVPSGDQYNYHTWVMDESMLDSPDGSSVGGWASCWIGTRPVQWARAVIRGRPRVFYLSCDPAADTLDLTFRSNVWEAFCSEKTDFAVNALGIPSVRPIVCSIETKYLSSDASYKTFDHIEWIFSEADGVVDIEGFYASRHSGYISVMDKQIVSTTDVVNSDLTELTNSATARLKQRRRIRSATNEADSNDGVEDPEHTQNMDKGFFVLTEWQGQIAMENIILYTNPASDSPHGKVEDDELTDRYIDSDGNSSILETDPMDSTPVSGKISSPVSTVSPRSQEVQYISLE